MPDTASVIPSPDIADLCAKYENENAHTEHVTRLALLLFDRTHETLGLRAGDRRLLEAAGRLHDIGYRDYPQKHLEGGIDIVQREGIRGFAAQQVAYVAAIISLHQADAAARIEAPLIQELGRPGRALQLGAILRVADGLDQGHVQDARIVSVRRGRDAITVTVASPLAPANITRADEKADLWRTVLPVPIRFVPDSRPASADERSVVRPGDSVIEAARRALYIQYKIMRQNEEGAKKGKRTEPLHDIRVAIRRFRAALRLFRKPLTKTSAAKIDRYLAHLALSLGPARDMDVWVNYLCSPALRYALAGDAQWKPYERHQRDLREHHLITLRSVLSGPRYLALCRKIAWFLRVELPRLDRATAGEPIGPYAARTLRRIGRRIAGYRKMDAMHGMEDFHALRKACRRGRYAAEFFGPVLGPRVRSWGKTCKKLADALGDLHDADVGLERIAYDMISPPRRLGVELRARRRRAVGAYHAAWDRLADPENMERFRRALKKMTREG